MAAGRKNGKNWLLLWSTFLNPCESGKLKGLLAGRKWRKTAGKINVVKIL
jgi:hypothetical protein